jgi:recombination protein RecA
MMTRKKEFKSGGSALEILKNRLSQVSGIYVSTLEESDISDINNWYSTPALDLNRILSGSINRGFPEKSMIVLAGPEASFKTSLCCLSLAQLQKEGYLCVVIDTEGAWSKDFCRRWGLDLSTVLYIYATWTSDIMQIVSNIKDSGDTKICIVIDSLGKIDRKKMLDDALDGDPKADQGALQKEIKKILKILQDITKLQNGIVFLTAHYYGNPNSGYGVEVEKLGGGNYLKLAPDIIISFKKSKKVDKDKNVIGSLIKAITLKNRYNPPFQEAIIDIDYTNGIDKYAGMLDLALKAGIVKQSGSWFSYDGNTVQGINNIEITEKMLNEIDEYLAKNKSYSIVNEIKESYENKNEEVE